MKVLLYSDVHMSKTSSIIRAMGSKYSARLENVIKSVDWAERLAEERNCEQVICLGDFFDKPELTAMELTALKDIKWANMPHIFIVGNHEADVASLKYNSTKALEGIGFEVISSTTKKVFGNTEITFIPYIDDDSRQPLIQYNTSKTKDIAKKQICFSHNDISGIQYGAFVSKHGFSLDEIKATFDLFINGHIHNSQWLDKEKHILDIGNLTGQTSNEDAFKYKHYAAIVDTDTLTVELVENPFAFNFYKIEIINESDLDILNKLKDNAVVIIKCDEKLIASLNKKLESFSNICEVRIIVTHQNSLTADMQQNSTITTVDHLEQFKKFCLEHIGNYTAVIDELEEVTK